MMSGSPLGGPVTRQGRGSVRLSVARRVFRSCVISDESLRCSATVRDRQGERRRKKRVGIVNLAEEDHQAKRIEDWLSFPGAATHFSSLRYIRYRKEMYSCARIRRQNPPLLIHLRDARLRREAQNEKREKGVPRKADICIF